MLSTCLMYLDVELNFSIFSSVPVNKRLILLIRPGLIWSISQFLLRLVYFHYFVVFFFFFFQKQLDLFFSILSELLQGTLKDLLKFWLETFLSINIQVFLPLTYSVKMGHVEKNFFHNYLLSWLSTNMLSMTCLGQYLLFKIVI